MGATAGIEDADERAKRRGADEELAAWIEEAPIEAVVDRWESQPVFADQPPELVAAQRPGRLRHDPRALAATLRSAGQGAMEPVWERLGALDLPLLAIAGERDERYADFGPADRRARSERACAAVVPGAGHAAQLEQPAAVAALVLDFLDEHFG